MTTEDGSDDEFDFQKRAREVGEPPLEELEELPTEELEGEELHADDVQEEEEEEEDVYDEGESEGPSTFPSHLAPRQEHVESNVSATTATTTEDEDYDDSSPQPTPSSAPKPRIVELGRAEDSELDEDEEEEGDNSQREYSRQSEEEEFDAAEDSDRPEFLEEEQEEAWEELPAYSGAVLSEVASDLEEKDEPVHYDRKAASDVDSVAKGSIDRFEKEEQTGPYQRDRTTTQEGWVAVRIGQNEWQERYAVIQPAFGLYAFEDEIAAQDWRRVDAHASYEPRLLLSCEGLHVTPDGDLSTEAESATGASYTFAVTISNDRSALAVVAFAETSRVEWLNALDGARSVADYVSACEELKVAPIPSLMRSALARPPLKALELKKYDLSDLDVLESVCQLAISSGRHLGTLRLENCALLEDGALLLRECVARLPCLQELDLTDNDGLGEVGTSAILSGVLKSRLRILALAGCNLGDGAGAELTELVAHSPALTRLDVSKNRLTPLSGIGLASALAHCSQMESLFLGSNPDLQDEMVGALASSFPAMHLLRELDLSNIHMTDRGLLRLERAFKDNPVITTSFECLDLRENHLLSSSAVKGFTQRIQFIRGVILLSDPPSAYRSIEDIAEAAGLSLATRSPNTSELESEPDTSSHIRVIFSGPPIPLADRLRDVLAGLLNVPKARVHVEAPDAGMEGSIELADDAVGALAQRLLDLQGEPKLRLLRILKLEKRPTVNLNLNRDNALVTLASRDDDVLVHNLEAVPLEVLSADASDALLEGHSLIRLQRDFENTAETLSPLTRSALKLACEGRLSKASVCSAGGLTSECEASVANEAEASGQLDVISLVQCAAVGGDLTRLRQNVIRTSEYDSEQARTGFARRLSDILVRSSPLKLAPEKPLSLFSRLRDTISRPLTMPLSSGGDDTEFNQGCERVFHLVQVVLGYEPRPEHDVDGSGAFSELLGVVLRSPELAAEMHLDLALRTCMNERSKPTNAAWTLAVLALRCAPIRKEIDSRLGLALSAAYKRYHERSKEPMALHAMRAIDAALHPEPEVFDVAASSGVLSHPLKRLDYIKRTFRRQAVSLNVSLPNGMGVLVDCLPFATLLETLVSIDKHLVAALGHGKDTARLQTLQTRWAGFHFVESDEKQWRMLHMGEDPHWWHFRTNKTLKLALEPIVALSLFPALSEADASSSDEHTQGDNLRLAQVYAKEKQVLKRLSASTKEADAQAVAYSAVLAVVEELGEDKFRSTSLGELFHAAESLYPLASDVDWSSPEAVERAVGFKNHVQALHTELLSAPRGSLSRGCMRAAFVNYSHVWPLSGVSTFVVKPKQSCNGGTVMDTLSLPKVATLTVCLRNGVSLLAHPRSSAVIVSSSLDFRSVIWSCDLRSLGRMDDKSIPNEIRLVVAGEEDWLVLEFPSAVMAATFRQVLLTHLWATLAHGGAVLPTVRWLEEFAFRFPHLPLPPHPPKLAVPPGGLLRTMLSREETETRLAAGIVIDYLIRPFSRTGKRQESRIVPRAFFFGPLEVSEVVLVKAASAGALDDEEAVMALPPLAPPPPQLLQGTDNVEFPLPLGPPPPLAAHQEDEESLLMRIIRPPDHPPPSPGVSFVQQAPLSPGITPEPAVLRVAPTAETFILQPPDFAAAPLIMEQPAAVIQGEDEEDEKAKRKREFLQKKREREQQQQSQET